MTEQWTELVRRVDLLISQLHAARAEAKHWQARAVEMDRFALKDDRTLRLEDQAKDRELERLRRERKKTIAMVEQLIAELEQTQNRIMEQPYE